MTKKTTKNKTTKKVASKKATTRKVAPKKAATIKPEVRPAPHEITPTQLINLAMEKNADISTLEKLMEFQRQHEYKKAHRSFLEAMNKFAMECPEIHKDSQADGADWRHASLGNAVNIIMPLSGKFGLTYRWEQSQSDDQITVRCILCHLDGHYEYSELSGPPDTSGDKNLVRAISSTNTMLQRYTLLSVFGLAPANDDDGAGGKSLNSTSSNLSAPLTPEQNNEVNRLIDTLEINRLGFLKWIKTNYKVNKVANIPSSGFDDTVRAIKANAKTVDALNNLTPNSEPQNQPQAQPNSQQQNQPHSQEQAVNY